MSIKEIQARNASPKARAYKLADGARLMIVAKTPRQWSDYRTLRASFAHEPRIFANNPIFAEVTHAGGKTYPSPGSAARLPADERYAPAPSPKIGQDTDEVLAELLGLGSGEIGKLHDAGMVA